MCKIKNCGNDGEPICEKHLDRMRKKNAREGSKIGQYKRGMWR